MPQATHLRHWAVANRRRWLRPHLERASSGGGVGWSLPAAAMTRGPTAGLRRPRDDDGQVGAHGQSYGCGSGAYGIVHRPGRGRGAGRPQVRKKMTTVSLGWGTDESIRLWMPECPSGNPAEVDRDETRHRIAQTSNRGHIRPVLAACCSCCLQWRAGRARGRSCSRRTGTATGSCTR